MVKQMDDDDQCEDCTRIARPWRNGRAAVFYRDMGRTLVLRLKHADRLDVARIALPWMTNVTRDFVGKDTVFVPIPLHWTRLVKRRYNQAAHLAHRLAMHFEKPAVLDGLTRVRPTQPLDGITLAERFARLEGALAANEKRVPKLQGKSVILVDDVMTSGATLAAGTEACLTAGAARVDVVVLARVVKDD